MGREIVVFYGEIVLLRCCVIACACAWEQRTRLRPGEENYNDNKPSINGNMNSKHSKCSETVAVAIKREMSWLLWKGQLLHGRRQA